MKIEYKVNPEKDECELHITSMTADQLDAIRIMLKTSADYGMKIKGEDFALEGLIKATWSKNEK